MYMHNYVCCPILSPSLPSLQEASLKHKLDGVEGAGMELGELREQLQSALEERETLRVQMDQTAASMQAEKQR